MITLKYFNFEIYVR